MCIRIPHTHCHFYTPLTGRPHMLTLLIRVNGYHGFRPDFDASIPEPMFHKTHVPHSHSSIESCGHLFAEVVVEALVEGATRMSVKVVQSPTSRVPRWWDFTATAGIAFDQASQRVQSCVTLELTGHLLLEVTVCLMCRAVHASSCHVRSTQDFEAASTVSSSRP
ncbi:hypothetical protein BU25DRAFT_160754 [Macroventuria anomochaeta]|uniref:Uncharacterized protein n=1 Tax=Macroventuria anomochaeta TaxID=301207 RepID=A0ACB6RQZ8_9PLEO|nr:uncharacterized protein BU25DRAFT_160754 [Macroventuria anomochaeta]KAF2624395.1 hypothetical protein BU25DRAFT_160754 [Macroventuria anomochaeta]